MGKNIKGNAVIQISDSRIRFIVGYMQNNTPYVFSITEQPISSLVSNGEIRDPYTLSRILTNMSRLKNEFTNTNLNINEASIVLPSIGFDIFEVQRATKTVSATNIIEQTDIRNLLSLVEKEASSDSTHIVDIIPDYYQLDNDKILYSNPIGEKTINLRICSKIHVVPTHIYESYIKIFQNANIRPRQLEIDAYCVSEYIKRNVNNPKNYLLMYLDSGYSSLSIINSCTPIFSQFINLGLHSLTQQISIALGISNEETEELLFTYGYDERDVGFEVPIIVSHDEFGRETKYYQNDLNNVVAHFMKDYLLQITNCINLLSSKCNRNISNLPFILCGEFLKINHIENLFKKHFGEEKVSVFSSDIVGARGPEYVSLIGALIVSHNDKTTLSETHSKISPISREEK